MAKRSEKEEKSEGEVVEVLAHCYGLAQDLFGDKANDYATEEIFDYLEEAKDGDRFMMCLAKACEYAKKIYKVEAPTPEQTFGVFERVYDGVDF